jgi:hypothetical protein
MSKKTHWRLHYWDSFAACKRSNGVSYHGDSYFSGVLIKICDYGESVIMATYYT